MAESRTDFDPKQAPKGWDYEKQGKPDILFWRYAGEEAAQAAKPTDVESLWKSNYEVAEEWRDTEIRKAEEENANKTVEEEKQPTNEHMVDKKPESDIIKEEKDSGNNSVELLDEKLIEQLAESGVKFQQADIVMITRNINGELLWLETGNNRAGLQHILDSHASDFALRGITDIPHFLKVILQKSSIRTGKGKNGLYADYEVNGKQYRVAYGTNGYIVSFYPCS